jgi:hypothetical protein
LKAVKEKKQITGKPIKITADFTIETLKAKAQSEEFQAVDENNFNPMICYLAKLSFKIGGEVKTFHNKQTLKQYIPPSQHFKEFYKEFCTQMKANKTIRGWEHQTTGDPRNAGVVQNMKINKRNKPH